MTEARKPPLPLPPRLDWFVHTQVGQLAQDGVPEWFHGAISRDSLGSGVYSPLEEAEGQKGRDDCLRSHS
uniref:Hematopoietic SH2 domain containing n=1 Tax=Nomascus leucogenys TaxID=61853 RepID=A0A2I3H2K0_NOMLE